MSYTVDIIYSKNQDYSNPQTVTQTGQPSSIELTNLDSDQAYYIKAVLKNDGTVEDEDANKFTTLPAGTIALTHQSSTRQGSNYVVVYTYTSTYALSSSILRCGASIAAQGVIAGNTITYTVSGLTPGDAYISQITTIDIYAESNVVTATLVMPVVNTINIIDTAPSDTEVEVELEYTVDGGFYEGFVSCWESTQDPETDPSLQHWAFHNGTTIVYCDNLTAGTTYKFRADIVLGDMTTEISSSVVTVTTSVDYKKQYLTITNTDSVTGSLKIAKIFEMSPTGTYLQYTLNGTTWSNYTNYGIQTITIPSGEKVMFRGNFPNGFNNQNNRYKFAGTFRCSVSGNPFSTRNTNPTTFSTYTTANSYEFSNLFQDLTGLFDASNLATSQITTAKESSFYNTFNGTNLERCPSFSGLETVERYALSYTFANTKIEKGADIRNASVLYSAAFNNMYINCTLLREVFAPNPLTKVLYEDRFADWLKNVAATGVVYMYSDVSATMDSASGVPSGWTTQNY